jgi:hypothetical protein
LDAGLRKIGLVKVDTGETLLCGRHWLATYALDEILAVRRAV